MRLLGIFRAVGASLCVLLAVHLNLAAISDPVVLWTERSHIWSKMRGLDGHPDLWLPKSHKQYIQTESVPDQFRYALAFSQETKELVWSDKIDKTIWRQPTADAVDRRNLDNIRPVLAGTSDAINGLAVDWLASNVYFTDGDRKWVGVAPLVTSRTDIYRILHSQELGRPTGIAVDPYEGMLFWADAESGTIETSSTDGLDRETIVSDSRYVEEPVGLTLDIRSKTIYWLDRDLRHIVSCDYDGRNERIIHEAENKGHGLDYFGISFWDEFLFVTTETELQLEVYNKTSGKLIETTDLDAYVYDITVLKEHDVTPHACKDLQCQHICLNQGQKAGQCACAQGYHLQLDGTTCAEGKPRYIYSIGHQVLMADLTIDETRPEIIAAKEKVVKDDQEKVQALGFSYQYRTLYFSDTIQDAIYRGNPDGGADGPWKELTVNTRAVEGIAVDWLSYNVYWTDRELGHIMVSQLDGRYHRILLEEVGEPLGIAVDPVKGYLYWVCKETSDDTPKIERANLDGTDRISFVETDAAREVQGLSMDVRTNRLYWTDLDGRAIYSMDVNTKEQTRIVNGLSSRLYDVTVFQEYTAWTDGRHGLRFMLDGMGEVLQSPQGLDHNGQGIDKSYDVIAYDSYLQPRATGACSDNNGGCHQLCFPTPGGRSCACAIGYRMRGDGKSCQSERTFGDFVLYTDPYHKQIYRASMNTAGGSTQGVPVPDMDFPISADYDSGDEKVYWLDTDSRQIRRAALDGRDDKTVLSLPSGERPLRLATDPTSRYLYYSTPDAIYKVQKNEGDKEKVLAGVQMTAALAVDFNNSMLYWAEEGSSVRIRRSEMDTFEASTVKDLSAAPSDISVIGEESMVYYSVREEGSIMALNVSTGLDSELFKDDSYQILAISANLKYIYFTTWNEKGVYRILREDGSDLTVLDRPIFARLTDVRAYDSRMPPVLAVTEEEGGIPILIIAAAAAGALLLLLLILAAFLIARRRRNPKAAAAAQNAPPDTEAAIDTVYNTIPDDTTTNESAPNGTTPNGNETTPNGNGTTPNENGTNENGNGAAPAEAVYQNTVDGVTVVPPVPPPKEKKWKFKRKSQQPPQGAPDNNAEFELNKEAKVATVIQRLTTRLRNRLASVRFSRSDDRPPLPQDVEGPTMEVAGGAVMTAVGPERGTDGPKGRKTHIPQKLHKLPRGYAPASRVVPPGITKSTWGRAKSAQVLDPAHSRQKTV